MERNLDTVIELQRAYDEHAELRRRLGGIPEWMSELHAEHSERKAEIDELETEIETAGAQRRAAEGEVADLKEKLKTYQEQLGRVRNQREYGALLQEIDGAKNQIKELEEGALAAFESQEEARKSVAELREAFAELDARYSSELEKWEAEKPEVAEQATQLEGRIEALRERLPHGILQQFERIFERYGGQALSLASRVSRIGRGPEIWSCGTCNYRVRPQAVVEILNLGAVVLCDSCKRILYVEEEAAG